MADKNKESYSPSNGNNPTAEINCSTMDSETFEYTWAGQSACSFRVKSKKSSHEVTTYAFLDPGSSATFCREDFLHKQTSYYAPWDKKSLLAHRWSLV